MRKPCAASTWFHENNPIWCIMAIANVSLVCAWLCGQLYYNHTRETLRLFPLAEGIWGDFSQKILIHAPAKPLSPHSPG